MGLMFVFFYIKRYYFLSNTTIVDFTVTSLAIMREAIFVPLSIFIM